MQACDHRGDDATSEGDWYVNFPYLLTYFREWLAVAGCSFCYQGRGESASKNFSSSHLYILEIKSCLPLAPLVNQGVMDAIDALHNSFLQLFIGKDLLGLYILLIFAQTSVYKAEYIITRKASGNSNSRCFFMNNDTILTKYKYTKG
jgi:hypothetical protein